MNDKWMLMLLPNTVFHTEKCVQNGICHFDFFGHMKWQLFFLSQGKIKLHNYGLYYLTKNGAEVNFPIG